MHIPTIERSDCMKILVREINYKEIEVPNDVTRFDVENMIQNCEVVIGDTTDTEYEVKFPESENWEELF